MKELEVYCTTSGELPKLVREGTPMTFVPYNKAKDLLDELTALKEQITTLPVGDVNKMLDDLEEPNEVLKEILKLK